MEELIYFCEGVKMKQEEIKTEVGNLQNFMFGKKLFNGRPGVRCCENGITTAVDSVEGEKICSLLNDNYRKDGLIIVSVTYQQLRKIYDLFGSVFFGYVRAMNIAHQGWLYEEALALCKAKNESDPCGVNFPDLIKDGLIEYTTRSGNKFQVDHNLIEKNGNWYGDITVRFSPSISIAVDIARICIV